MNSTNRDSISRSGAVLTVCVALFVLTWGVHQNHCSGRPSKNVDIAPHAIRMIVLEGKCYFSAMGEASVSFKDLDQELVIEEGGEYELKVESEDYVYSLRQPDLSLNVVAVPGLVSILPLQTEHSGNFELELAPMCGFPWKHQGAPGVIVVEKRRRGKCD